MRSVIRKLILCILVIVISAVPAIFINRIYGYLPSLMALILVLGSFLYMQILSRSLKYNEDSDFGSCTRGTKIDFTVHMRNSSLLYYPLVEPYFYITDLFGEDDTVTSDIITLAPREKREFEFDARFDHIGTYSAGLRKIKIQDMLGLFSRTLENEKRYEVSVIPKVYEIEKIPFSQTAQSESNKMTRVNPLDASDYAGVREYVIGDPIKNIHWKLSARSEGYLTKEFESYSTVGVCVIIDFHAPAYSRDDLMSIFDCVVETALSVGTYAVKEGMEAEILYYDKRGEKIQSSSYLKENYVELMKTMQRIHTEPDRYRALDLLQEQGRSLYSQGNLAYCTADITDELIDMLISVRNHRKNPMLFAVIPDQLDDEIKEKKLAALRPLDSAGIWYHVLSDASSLEGGDLS